MTGALLGVLLLPGTAAPGPRVAELGVEFPGIANLKYYDRAAFADIRDNLRAAYVRTGWIPDFFKMERIRWAREDRGMRRICHNGLAVMIILPSVKDDARGEDDLVANVGEFFERYQKKDPGCVRWAEVANEADIPTNGFKDVDAYARYYERVAPIVARYGVKVVTSGTSGKDLPWTYELAAKLRTASPPVPVDGFGFHPYGVPPEQMQAAVAEMRRAASAFTGGRSLPDVYVTEIGEKDARRLYDAILALAPVTPVLTVFEYRRTPDEETGYGLTDNPPLYEAVKRAFTYLRSG